MPCLIALDPGREKCGYAVLDFDGSLLEKGIVPAAETGALVGRLMHHGPELLVLGKGTASHECHEKIRELQPSLKILLVDERNTTYEARRRYFRENPPTGFWKYIPQGLQYPPVPIDDFAAWLIGEKFLAKERDSRLPVKSGK